MNSLIVHEWLSNNAGSERVVAAMREALPGAPVATTIRSAEEFRDWDVITTRLQRFARGPDSHIPLLPFMPAAWRMLKLPPADVVVTSFHTFAMWARVPDDVNHVVYCHTAPRFLWDREQIGDLARVLHVANRAGGGVMRYLDRRKAIGRPVRWLANSAFTAERLKSAYGVDADVLYPPVDVAPFSDASRRVPKGEHFLVFGRVVPYKRVDLAVEAFRRLGLPLIVAGSGRDLDRLRRDAPGNVSFVGYVPEDEKPRLMASARALIVPGIEDFGIVPHEAAAAGTPIIAYRRGGLAEAAGALPTTWFDEQTPESLASAVRACIAAGPIEPLTDPAPSAESFQKGLLQAIEENGLSASRRP